MREASCTPDDDEVMSDGEDEFLPNVGENDDDEGELEFVTPKKFKVKVMRGICSPRKSTSNKKQCIFTHRDAGFGEAREFKTREALLNGLNDSMEEYMHPNDKYGFDVVTQMIRYG